MWYADEFVHSYVNMILFNLSSIKQAHMGQHYQKLAEGELTVQVIAEKL